MFESENRPYMELQNDYEGDIFDMCLRQDKGVMIVLWNESAACG